jgi:hypothetical protein
MPLNLHEKSRNLAQQEGLNLLVISSLKKEPPIFVKLHAYMMYLGQRYSAD